MARTRPTIDFNLDGRLSDQRETNLGVDVPIPVSERLETLAQRLYEEGHGRVARKELVAAVVHAAPTDPEKLYQLLHEYRRARVRDTYVGEVPTGNVVTFSKRAPGPRARAK